MDSYKLDEVKILFDKNLLTTDILKRILESSKRRIELYDDEESIEILKYLNTLDIIPEDIQDEINKYLADYNASIIDNKEKEEIESKVINWRIVLIYSLIISLVIVAVSLIIMFR